MKRIFLFAIFTVATVAAIIGRLFQLLQMIDPKTGFYYPQYEGANVFILISLAVIILILVLLARFDNSYPQKPVAKSFTLGACTLALSIVVLIHCVDQILSARIITTEEWIYFIVGLLFAEALVYYGICLLAGARVNAFSCLFPVIFAGYRLAASFIEYTGMAKIPDVILDIVMLGLCMIFWLYFGKTAGRVKYEKSVKWVYGTGLSAAMLCIVCTLPEYFIQIFMAKTAVHSMLSAGYLDLAVSAYIIVFLIFHLLPRRELDKEERLVA